MLDTAAETLVSRAAERLRAYLDSRGSTDLLKEAAESLCDLREAHHLRDGRTDWNGRSAGYRAAAAEVYARAGLQVRDGLDEAQVHATKTVLRHHVLLAVQRRAPASELEDAGVSTQTINDRRAQARRQKEAQLRATTDLGTPSERILLASVLLENAVAAVETSILSEADRVQTVRELRAISKRVELLRAQIDSELP